MSTNDEQPKYGKIINVSPADERGRVTVTHEDGTKVTVNRDQLPKAEQREPLLSDDDANKMRDATWRSGFDSWEDPMNATRDFYENLITSGELMVCKTAKQLILGGGMYSCSECGRREHYSTVDNDQDFNFCPGCGAQIVP